jgi:hypothetical protein
MPNQSGGKMKVFKKVFSLFWVICAAVGIFFGCSVSFPSDSVELPADGIIKRPVFQDAKKNSRMLTFRGKSGGIAYSWFFDGASIAAPSDQNLKVDFRETKNGLDKAVSSSELLELTFHEKHLIEAKTTLTVDFPKLLDARKVRIYRKKSGEITRFLEAPLNNGGTSSVTFPVNDTDGDFYLAVMDSAFYESPSLAPPNPLDGSQSDSGGASSESGSPSSGAVNSGGTGSGEETNSSTSSHPAKKAALGSSSLEASGKDRYHTDPTPAGKPKPVEPRDVQQNTKEVFYCTLSIDCKTVLNHMDQFNPEKKPVLPADGVVFKPQKVVFYKGESVFDVLLRETKKNEIQMEYKGTPAYDSSYIEGIHNLYAFDCGNLSGWMYQVNGWYPNYGCSRYLLKDGDVVNWRYTCDLGRDVGNDENLAK